MEREAHRLGNRHGDLDRVAERILGLDLDLDRLALNLGLDDAGGIGDRRQAAIGASHPERRRELGPALVHVGRAAAEVGLQPVEVRVRAIIHINVLTRLRADHLVALLIVLMRGHVFLERGGQGVERELLEPVAQAGVARDGGEELEGIHGFHHGAELGSLRRAAAGQVLVAGEDAGGLAVVAVEQIEHGEDRSSCRVRVSREQVADAAVLERHGRCSRRGCRARTCSGSCP